MTDSQNLPPQDGHAENNNIENNPQDVESSRVNTSHDSQQNDYQSEAAGSVGDESPPRQCGGCSCGGSCEPSQPAEFSSAQSHNANPQQGEQVANNDQSQNAQESTEQNATEGESESPQPSCECPCSGTCHQDSQGQASEETQKISQDSKEQAVPASSDNKPAQPKNNRPNHNGHHHNGKGKYHDDHEHHPHDVPCNTVTARYGAMRAIGEFRHNISVQPTIGTKLVVRTERGVELATVIMPIKRTEDQNCAMHHITGEKLDDYIKKCGEEFPFETGGKVLRLANNQDLVDFRHLDHSAHEAGKFCREEIKKRKLDMELVKVEHLLGGERIIFYFTAEHRVDFRDLVKNLANQFRTRIEMRQVGARDEARLVADFERCGQRCCCQQFLKLLRPVSMRMAKVQKATLDPSKISGRCGRLMCCLRYEDEGYEYLRKKLPRRNSWVRTESGLLGRVADTQIITQLVKIELPSREFEAVNVSEIVERDLPEPSPEVLRKEASKPKPVKKPVEPIAPVTYFSADEMREIDKDLPDEKNSDDNEQSQDRKKRRRRRRRKPGGSDNRQSNSKNRDNNANKNRNGNGSRDGNTNNSNNENRSRNRSDNKSGDGSAKRKRRRRGGRNRRPGGNRPNNEGNNKSES